MGVFFPSRSVSLTKVAKDIADVFENEGYDVDMVGTPYFAVDVDERVDAAVFVHVFDPMVVQPWVYKAVSMARRGYPVVFYTTVEGVPMMSSSDYWMVRDMRYVANSEYTRKKLAEVGADAPYVVYHGVKPEKAEEAKEHIAWVEDNIMSKGKIKALYLAAGYPRKGHHLFAKVIKKMEGSPIHFYIVTDSRGAAHYAGLQNATALPLFGKLSEEQIMAMYLVADFYVHPSLSEGFGLPVAEALCAGKLAVHPNYQPLTEITTPDTSLRVRVVSVKYETLRNSMIKYEHHMYDIDEMVRAIEKAASMGDSDMSKVREVTKRRCAELDVKKQYLKLKEIMDRLSVMPAL